jgi:gamma-glutamyltranspeptidase/glutathione hydrolase
MVPGAPKGWAELVRRFGALSLPAVMEPAIDYARNGYPVSANLARMWGRALEKYRKTCSGPAFEEWYRTFAPDGRAPSAGEIVRLPNHARTLELIAESRAEAFYRGELADRIVADSEEFGTAENKDGKIVLTPSGKYGWMTVTIHFSGEYMTFRCEMPGK